MYNFTYTRSLTQTYIVFIYCVTSQHHRQETKQLWRSRIDTVISFAILADTRQILHTFVPFKDFYDQFVEYHLCILSAKTPNKIQFD